MNIEQTTASTINDLWTGVESQVENASYLEEAAQALTAAMHQEFGDSVVIARVFFTVPFDNLPPPPRNQAFVKNLAESAGAETEFKTATPVLSLISTHGAEAEWNDRRKSKGHAGIPLISSEFVGAIPMISRLLKELGVPLDWVDGHDSSMIEKTMARSAGLFFVEDASEATDQEGRKIIAAQDFVSQYGVKGVFGIGGAYVGGQMLVLVVFCRDSFQQASAEPFMALTTLFKTKTSSLVGAGKVFAEP